MLGNFCLNFLDTADDSPVPTKQCKTNEDKYKRNIEKYSLRPPCSCPLQCLEKISQQKRIKVWQSFWRMTKDARDSFMYGLLEITAPKIAKRDAASNRSRTISYFMKDPSGVRQKVCKTFFSLNLWLQANSFRGK